MNLFLIQHNHCSRYLVVIDGDVYVYKYEKCKFDQPFLCFQTKYVFNGKSKISEMTDFSGANDSSDFDGSIILLEGQNNDYLYFSACEIIKFKTDDKSIDYISLMGNNMCLSTNAVGEKNTYFISEIYKFFENGKIEEGTLLNATNDNLDPFFIILENVVQILSKR